MPSGGQIDPQRPNGPRETPHPAVDTCRRAKKPEPPKPIIWNIKSTVAHLACLLVVIFSPTLVLFFALSFPNYRTSSRVVKRLSERVQYTSRVNDRTFIRVVIGIFDALAAKPPIPPVLNTLLTARKDAINASGVSYDAPWIVYICLHFSQPGEHRR
jgi:hypothetical protein